VDVGLPQVEGRDLALRHELPAPRFRDRQLDERLGAGEPEAGGGDAGLEVGERRIDLRRVAAALEDARARWAAATKALRKSTKTAKAETIEAENQLVADAKAQMDAATKAAEKQVRAARKQIAAAEHTLAAKAKDSSASARSLVKKQTKAAKAQAAAAQKTLNAQLKNVKKQLGEKNISAMLFFCLFINNST